MYVRYTLCSLFKPSSAGDSKTTVGTYTAVIHTLHYCTPFARCLWRSTAMYSTAMTIPPFRLLHANYPSTILGIQYDSANAFDDSDCADALLQIRRHPLTIPWTPFDNSADTLWRFCGHPLTILQTPFDNSSDTLWQFFRHPLMIPRISLTMPWKNCALPTQWICGFRKVSCDVYRMYTHLSKDYHCHRLHVLTYTSIKYCFLDSTQTYSDALHSHHMRYYL